MKTAIRAAVFLLLILFAAGCGSAQEEVEREAGEYQIYYLNQERNSLVSRYGAKTEKEGADLVLDLLDQMENLPLSNVDYVSAIPKDLVNLEGVTLESGRLTLNFSTSYYDVDPIQEILCRAAIVKTMCQIDGVEYVAFTVGNQPLTDSKGNVVGVMKGDSFLEDSGGDNDQLQPMTLILYFTNETGDQLIETEQHILYNTSMSAERVVLTQLIEGPTQEGLYPTLPEDTDLLSIQTKDGVCYVNLNEAFLTSLQNVADYIPIYSIVNSLSELPNINKVQITVNGSTNVKFRDSISLDTMFERNLDYIGGTSN